MEQISVLVRILNTVTTIAMAIFVSCLVSCIVLPKALYALRAQSRALPFNLYLQFHYARYISLVTTCDCNNVPEVKILQMLMQTYAFRQTKVYYLEKNDFFYHHFTTTDFENVDEII